MSIPSPYLVLKNPLSPEQMEYVLNCYNGNQVDYHCMKQFIENIMLPIINNELGWNCVYTKFRVSDNNNSADASAFHRDIFHTPKNPDVFPIYTCLIYLDHARMEIIPNSHQNCAYSYYDALAAFKNNSQQIKLEPGDILVFHSNMLHRGIFTDGLKSRKLIQVFDVYPDPQTFANHHSKIMHVEGKEGNSDLFIKLSKNKFASAIMNFFGFLNSATGYGNNHDLFKDNATSGKQVISSEGLRGRITIDKDQKYQPINKYVFNEKLNGTQDTLPEYRYDNYHYNCYKRQFISYSIAVLILVIVILYMIYSLVRFMKTPKSKSSSRLRFRFLKLK